MKSAKLYQVQQTARARYHFGDFFVADGFNSPHYLHTYIFHTNPQLHSPQSDPPKRRAKRCLCAPFFRPFAHPVDEKPEAGRALRQRRRD